MTRRFEDSEKGAFAKVIDLAAFFPREIFTAEKDQRPTARLLLGGTMVVLLGTRMKISETAQRKLLVMLNSEIGWIDEDHLMIESAA